MSRLTKEQKDKIAILKQEGKSNREIAVLLGTTLQTIRYWSDSAMRNKAILSSRKWLLNKPLEQRRVIYNKRKDYFKKYIFERYHNDEVFREKHKQRCRKSNKMKGGLINDGNKNTFL
jgi:IS30 family transposase